MHTLLNNCVLFALVKLAFVALLSGSIWGFGSRVAFTFRAVNTIIQKGYLYKKSHMYCAKEQSVFGRLFGWMHQSFCSLCVSANKLNSTNTALSDEQQKRTLDTVTNHL